MRKIMASINVDSDSIKLLVGEFNGSHLNILSASKVSSSTSFDDKKSNIGVIDAIKNAVKEASETLGIEIKKVILGIDERNLKLVKSEGKVDIKSESKVITGEDIDKVLSEACESKIPEKYALVSIMPAQFTIDNDKKVREPLGRESSSLSVKAILALSPKEYVKSLLEIIEESGLKVVDVVINTLGDYATFETNSTRKDIGAIINLGYDISTISIFNKGILTNTKCYNAGYKSVIKDIGYIYKIDTQSATGLYRDLALASTRLANVNEYRNVINEEGKEVRVNQYEISEIASSRIEEILNLAKKQINILTKKEISYIIVTGGLTELKDFSIILEKVIGKSAYLGDVKNIGARDNNYASTLGILKYYKDRLDLRGKSFSMFTTSELEEMNDKGKRESENKESIFGKVFGYFFES